MSRLLKLGGWKPVVGLGRATKGGPERERHLGYANQERNAFIIGDYTCKSGFGGGCDLLFPEEVVRRIQLFTQQYKFVLLEGILVSHTFGRYHELSMEIEDYRFAFLDTPLATCLERITNRRKTAVGAKGREFKMDSAIKDFTRIGRVKEKCVMAGLQVITLDHTCPVAQVILEMKKCPSHP
jgi:hypothetical protein